MAMLMLMQACQWRWLPVLAAQLTACDLNRSVGQHHRHVHPVQSW